LHLALNRTGGIEDDNPLWLYEGADVQHRNQDTGSAGEDDGDEVGAERVELAQVAGLRG
jgi:hypothetical protein